MKVPNSLKYEPIMADNIMHKLPTWNANPADDIKIDFMEPFLIMLAFMMLGGLLILGMGCVLIHFENQIAESVGWLVAL